MSQFYRSSEHLLRLASRECRNRMQEFQVGGGDSVARWPKPDMTVLHRRWKPDMTVLHWRRKPVRSDFPEKWRVITRKFNGQKILYFGNIDLVPVT